MKKTGRYAATETLYQLDKTKKSLTIIFDRVVEECGLSDNERHLAMKISYGVLRNRSYLEGLLEILCTQPVNKIKPFVRQALLAGLYQLFFLDRIPPSAAVNETVNVVKAKGFAKQLEGFVNGVLRASLRQKEQLPTAQGAGNDDLLFLNHPNWLIKRWQNRFGTEQTRQICQHNNLEPVLGLRANSEEKKRDLLTWFEQNKIEALEGAYGPYAIILPDHHGSIESIAGFEQGVFQVQDQAAQLATPLLAPFAPGYSYLDGCAGLGGKTSHLALLAEKTKETSSQSLTAVEPDRNRFRLLTENLARTTLDDTISLHNETLQDFARASSILYDRILLDAPCSGTGVIGRHPDIRWTRTESDLAGYGQKQLNLLETAAALLSPNGVLVYATCSIEPEENDRVVERFLEMNPDFSPTDCREYLPDSAAGLVRDGFFAPLPGFGIDGFFAARLVKKGV